MELNPSEKFAEVSPQATVPDNKPAWQKEPYAPYRGASAEITYEVTRAIG